MFSPGDAAGRAVAIRATLEMTTEARDAMRRAAHQVYRAQFTAPAMNDQYEEEYRRLRIEHLVCADQDLAA